MAITSGQFLGECYLARDQFAPATDLGYPPMGITRIYARTDAGQTLAAQAPEGEIREKDHPLHTPWAAAQAVITQIRLVSSDPGSAAASA